MPHLLYYTYSSFSYQTIVIYFFPVSFPQIIVHLQIRIKSIADHALYHIGGYV